MRARVRDTELYFDVEGASLVPDGPRMVEKWGVQTGADPLAWCGMATDLHVPGADPAASPAASLEASWTVLRAELVPEGRRNARLEGGTAPVSGAVVPELA